MRATISIADNTVIVDGRPLKVDCSSLDPNIKLVQWYGEHGDVEFINDPTQPFRRNGKLDSLGDFRAVVDAWQAQADKIDADQVLKSVPPDEAVRLMSKIASDPTLKAASVGEAVRLLQKVERDPELTDTPLNAAVQSIKTIEASPELNAVYPGVAHQHLNRIKGDAKLRNKPVKDAMEDLAKADVEPLDPKKPPKHYKAPPQRAPDPVPAMPKVK